jgi:TP901 family phage tail tape measure protein
MANSFIVTADLRIDPKSLNSTSKQVKQALGRITGQASEFQKSLDASTARVFAFGATTTVLNGVSQSFRALIKSTVDVQKRLTEINAIFQQSEAVINSFREAIFRVAQETGQAFSTVADAAAELARQGLSAEETANRLKAALILTRISGLGAEDSVKTLTAAINGFTSAALTAEEVTNKIVAVDTAFAVSAEDLAQGLARAGSTAEDAGVSFDQLLGLITAVEQRTARGGAVIGNAFKSIFTRLSRGTTISELQDLGVEIDASQSGIEKLNALSKAIEGIADPTTVSKIKELAGGVFQINVVSAALKDLSSETSAFTRATQEAATASDDAFRRNAELNKTLAAQINELIAGLTNLGSKIGSITFGPILENLLGVANKITSTLNNLFSEEDGSTIAKGLLKGIGSFISGPGLVLVTSAFLKIVQLVTKFAIEGFRTVSQIGSATEKIRQIETGIVQLLSQDENLRNLIASSTATQAQKEQAVIQAIKTENALLTQQEVLLRRIASLAAAKGVTGFSSSSGFTGGGGRRFSAGYIPNFARQEFKMEEAEARALGATPSVKAKKSKGTIGGRKFIMNNQEVEIPNFGKNGDSAVIPRYAKGFIPNFVQDPIEKYSKSDAEFWGTYYNSNGNLKATGKKLVALAGLSDVDLEKRAGVDPKTKKPNTQILATLKKNRETGKKIIKVNEERKSAKEFVLRPVNLEKLNSGNSLPTILTPKEEKGSLPTSSEKTNVLRPIDYSFPIRGISESFREKLGSEFEAQFDAKSVEKDALKQAVTQTNLILDALGDPQTSVSEIKKKDEIKGFTGAVRSAAGAIFDASVTTALNVKGSKKGEGGDFDVRGNPKNFSKLFGVNPLPKAGFFKELGDFKFSSGAQDSMKKKTLTELRDNEKEIYKKLKIPERLKGRAAGYVPNFAREKAKEVLSSGRIPNFARSALDDAVKREKSAGLPESRIRIDQSDRLKNKQNPAGLAVTNTRDEPNGLRDVFASGYIPNFAANTVSGITIETPNLDSLNLSVKNAKDGLDDIAEKGKKTGGALDSLAAFFIAQQAVALVDQAVTDKANSAKSKEVEILQKKLESDIETIKASKDVNKNKELEIQVLQKRFESEKAAIEANVGVAEKLTGLASSATTLVITFSTIAPLIKSFREKLANFQVGDIGGGVKQGLSGAAEGFKQDLAAPQETKIEVESEAFLKRIRTTISQAGTEFAAKLKSGFKAGAAPLKSTFKQGAGFLKRELKAGAANYRTSVAAANGATRTAIISAHAKGAIAVGASIKKGAAVLAASGLKFGAKAAVALGAGAIKWGLRAGSGLLSILTGPVGIVAAIAVGIAEAAKNFFVGKADEDIALSERKLKGFLQERAAPTAERITSDIDRSKLSKEENAELDRLLKDFVENFDNVVEKVSFDSQGRETTSKEDSAAKVESEKALREFAKRKGSTNLANIEKLEKQIAAKQKEILDKKNEETSLGISYNQAVQQKLELEKQGFTIQAQLQNTLTRTSNDLNGISSLLPESARKIFEFGNTFQQGRIAIAQQVKKFRISQQDFGAAGRQRASAQERLEQLKDVQRFGQQEKEFGSVKEFDDALKEAQEAVTEAQVAQAESARKVVEAQEQLRVKTIQVAASLFNQFDAVGRELQAFGSSVSASAISNIRDNVLGTEEEISREEGKIKTDVELTLSKNFFAKTEQGNAALIGALDKVDKTLKDPKAIISRVKGQAEAFAQARDERRASQRRGGFKGDSRANLESLRGLTTRFNELRSTMATVTQDFGDISPDLLFPNVKVGAKNFQSSMDALIDEISDARIDTINKIRKEGGGPVLTKDQEDVIRQRTREELGDQAGIDEKVRKKVDELLKGLGASVEGLQNFAKIGKFPEATITAASNLSKNIQGAATATEKFKLSADFVTDYLTKTKEAVTGQNQSLIALKTANDKLSGVVSEYDSNIVSLSGLIADLIGQINTLQGKTGG